MAKKSNLMKWLIIAVIALIVIAVVGKKMGWVGGEKPKTVSVEKASLRSIVETVSASGKIQPEVAVKISPDVSGEIVELNVKEGDRVTKGQLLARILPDIYQSYVDRSIAALNSSKANVENAKSRLIQVKSQFEKAKLTYERNQKLFNEKLISASEWEGVKSAFEVAKAEVSATEQNISAADYGVRSAEASVKEAQDNLRKTSIFAPVDATISKLNVEKGERVVGTSQFAGTEIMTLANLNEMEVRVDVNENDIVRVNVGDTASVEVDAYLGKKFQGVVTEVANSANTSGLSVDQVTNFTVKIRILRESYDQIRDPERPNRAVFNPGMSATVDIMTKKVYNAISVPIQAVTTRDTSLKSSSSSNEDVKQEAEEDESVKVVDESKNQKKTEIVDNVTECVFVIADGTVKLRPVLIGIQDNNFIEIKSGLKEGDEVVTGPYSSISKLLKDGDKIEVVKKEELFSKDK
ncbi:MAG: efflux RND transporter periplasmic adaptor subunit [Bacteroidetes bacterium]|nr:MAG: efflux RND transporter periplasmic adaptor subunit [Bacteroidota bacterium]